MLTLCRNRQQYAEKCSHYAENCSQYVVKCSQYAEKCSHYAEKCSHYAEIDNNMQKICSLSRQHFNICLNTKNITSNDLHMYINLSDEVMFGDQDF